MVPSQWMLLHMAIHLASKPGHLVWFWHLPCLVPQKWPVDCVVSAPSIPKTVHQLSLPGNIGVHTVSESSFWELRFWWMLFSQEMAEQPPLIMHMSAFDFDRDKVEMTHCVVSTNDINTWCADKACPHTHECDLLLFHNHLTAWLVTLVTQASSTLSGPCAHT